MHQVHAAHKSLTQESHISSPLLCSFYTVTELDVQHNKRTADIMVYCCILLNNAMVKCTEKEGSGLLGGGMPSARTAGKRVPLSSLS